jgi:hypothetical protein
MTLRQRFLLFVHCLLGAACLVLPALYNGFPLVTADSGGYISNSFTLYLPIDRPVGYSAFLRVSSLGLSLWAVIGVQAMLVSGLLLLLTRQFLREVYSGGLFLGIMPVLGVATSVGWTVSQLSPDVFTAVLLLSLGCLFYVPLRNVYKLGLWALVLGSLLIHNSNLLIASLLALGAIAWGWRKPKLKRFGLALLGLSAAGWISFSTMNAIAGRGFRPSSASHVFIMSRMAENGVLEAYLKDRCATEPSSLCAYQGKLPERQWNFMWDNNSPLYIAGGWEATEQEYSRIIRQTLMSPKYVWLHALTNAKGTLQQLSLLKVGDELAPLGAGSSPYLAIEKYHPAALNAYSTARQRVLGWDISVWNSIILVFELLALVALLIGYFSRKGIADKRIRQLRSFLRLCVYFLIINAAVTVTFATVVARYHTRVFWVIPFLSILYIIRLRQLSKAATS